MTAKTPSKPKKRAKKAERHSVSADERARRAYDPAGHAANDPTNETSSEITPRTATRDEPADADHRDAEGDERTPKDESRRGEDVERGSEADAPIERDADEWSHRAGHDPAGH